VAIGTVTLPVVPAAPQHGNTAGFRAIQQRMRLAFLLTFLPRSAGHPRHPIIGLILSDAEHSAPKTRPSPRKLFSSMRWTVRVCGIKVLAPSFLRAGKAHTPNDGELLSIAVNYGYEPIFTFTSLWARGLALSTGLVALTNFILLYSHEPPGQRLETGDDCDMAKLAVAGAFLAVCAGARNVGAATRRSMGSRFGVAADGVHRSGGGGVFAGDPASD